MMQSLEADRKYAEAHESHYGTKNLEEALAGYLEISAAVPGSRQAGYARSQIQNIARAVVSEQDLLDAQVDLVRAHLRAQTSTT